VIQGLLGWKQNLEAMLEIALEGLDESFASYH
jgi:hypothetical protein